MKQLEGLLLSEYGIKASGWDAFITPPSSWCEEHVGKISEWLLATWAKGEYAL